MIKRYYSFHRAFLLSFALFLSLSLCGGELDSLKGVVNSLDDDQKAAVYNRIFVLSGNYKLKDSTLFFAEQALLYSTESKDSANLAFAYRNLAFYYNSVGNFIESTKNYRHSLKILKVRKDLRRIIIIYNELSNVLVTNNQYKEASKILFEALEFSESNDYEFGNIEINRNLGTLFRQLMEFEKAEFHLSKALDLEQQKEKPNLRSLSSLQRSLGLTKYDQKDYDKALIFFNEGLKSLEKVNDARTSMMMHNSIALVYSEQTKQKEALHHYNKALNYAEQSESANLITAARLNIGREYSNMGNYIRALAELQKGMNLAEENGYIKWQRNGHGYLSTTYEKQGNYQLAIGHLKSFHLFDDSLNIQQSQVEIADLEAKYESVKKERQIELLNKENELKQIRLNNNRIALYLVLGFIVILGLFAYNYFKQYKHKQKSLSIIKKQNAEKKLLSAVIKTEDKERKRFAADLHDGLGPILSSIKLYLSSLNDTDDQNRKEMIEYSNELIDTSITSLRTISNNILPVELSESGLIASIKTFCNKLQFTKKIDIKIDDETNNKRIENSTELILYRVVQELINNTIKHADANQINIHFKYDQQKYSILYEDDGNGFDLDQTRDNKSSLGLGLNNIHDRVESLRGTLNFETGIEKGVKAMIDVPI